MISKSKLKVLGAVLMISSLTACQATIPKDALVLSQQSLADRQLQSRYFETKDEAFVLSSSSGVLQDLGFNLDESETELGLIVSSKNRDATEAGQVVAAILIAVLFGSNTPVDKEQKIRVSLVTSRSKTNENQTLVRVTFQRIVWNTHGDISRAEKLNDAEIYSGFFEKLSKALFLEAHQI